MPHLIPIDDPDDPRVEPYRDVRERDLVGRQGLFVAEGAVVLRQLLVSPRVEPLSLLVAAHRVDALAEMLAEADATLPVYVAAQPVLDRVAGFALHRGLLGIGRLRAREDADALLAAAVPGAATVVAACGIGNHDNIGGIFRNAAAFGAAAVLLDAGCCDPLYRKAIRVSVGATLRVPFARVESGAALLGALERHGFAPLALTPQGGTALHRLRPPPRSALLLGAEGPGLPDAILARATRVCIPMAAGFDSLNVATTSGIVLHHLAATAGRLDRA